MIFSISAMRSDARFHTAPWRGPSGICAQILAPRSGLKFLSVPGGRTAARLRRCVRAGQAFANWKRSSAAASYRPEHDEETFCGQKCRPSSCGLLIAGPEIRVRQEVGLIISQRDSRRGCVLNPREALRSAQDEIAAVILPPRVQERPATPPEIFQCCPRFQSASHHSPDAMTGFAAACEWTLAAMRRQALPPSAACRFSMT